MNQLFFDNWDGILRVLITTVIAYFLVILMLRISGKRTLAKMNAFDTIVTIALGSILGSVILNKSTPIAEGLLAIALLIFLQFVITSITVRSRFFKKIISNTPTLIYYKGELLHPTMKKERISIGEINKSVREAGHANFDDIDAIVLETTGDITIITNNKEERNSAMTDVKSSKF
ncbi:DUF421 domain-containing protein [Frigoriflavimonas asaccharolytica]|uniref:Uncharacterized membrane protein YcaP (DUF421 family) n=1 Tax=Frigoriflavimonas asaccharolytica TaxID=2735899 RepID=A0A8J8G7X9_9FLAO|nr:YetF domain-containing protein [Frigoriflavimonas asaccharolytica]NRS92921.1 uncharacterized membrane protein YcaP (DUF421 family) [Frigoriflavimonas asaccharolytica]